MLLGSLANAIGIVLGTLIGLLLRRIPGHMKQTVKVDIGVAVIVLGLEMALKSNDFFIVIVSLVVCAIIGERMRLEDQLHRTWYHSRKEIRK
ncbi:DUF554 family protein [Bacillus sp. ISL-4]|uniref:DUF554 family protein n=1 Tax=Bacillus sp. ISL-4 TaxID=2819125 RepID=UPI001BE6DB2F|nr:DUF554 family protein [Bacillus sp. ISL-4]